MSVVTCHDRFSLEKLIYKRGGSTLCSGVQMNPLTSKNIYTSKFDLFNLFNLVIISFYVNDTCQLLLVMTNFLLKNLSVKGAALPFVKGFK